jgi:hypothetical protein
MVPDHTEALTTRPRPQPVREDATFVYTKPEPISTRQRIQISCEVVPTRKSRDSGTTPRPLVFNRKTNKSTHPCFGIDHPPTLQQSLPDALFPRVPMVTVSCIVHNLFRRSPIGGSEWLIPGGEDIIVRDEWARMLQDDVTTRKINLQPVKTLAAVISCRSR